MNKMPCVVLIVIAFWVGAALGVIVAGLLAASKDK
jgi:hypothetical protein